MRAFTRRAIDFALVDASALQWISACIQICCCI
jgi:hypothetical protein